MYLKEVDIMHAKIYNFGLLITLFLLIQPFRSSIAGETDQAELKNLKQAIIAKGANWTATENFISHMSLEEGKQLCGTLLESGDIPDLELITLSADQTLPAVFDWRNNSGNWITPVKNQGSCGSCWCFSVVSQMESWWKIKHGDPNLEIDLSEQFVVSFSEGTCEHGQLRGALDFVTSNGIPSENCFPYQEQDEIIPEEACENWEDKLVQIPGWGYVTSGKSIVENIKYALYQQPVAATLKVYSDLQSSYQAGVYEYVAGDFVGGHAVLIIGWNDHEQSWICKNSWGKGWGEEGYFRIKWDACEIGKYIPMIWDEVNGNNALAINPDKIDLKLTKGDSVIQYIKVTNLGENGLEFATMEIEPARYKKRAKKFYIYNGTGRLLPDESTYIKVILKTDDIEPGNYQNRIQITSNDTSKIDFMIHCNLELQPAENIVSLEGLHVKKPETLNLGQNYPNPFNPSTTIEFVLPESEFVTLNVYNILGEEIFTIVSKKLQAGNHTYQFDGRNFASGVYYYRIEAGKFHDVKKMNLVR
jgi:C1A family cysteine protease